MTIAFLKLVFNLQNMKHEDILLQNLTKFNKHQTFFIL